MGKPVSITLTVEASTLYAKKPYPPAQSVVDGLCTLGDTNHGNSPNGTIEDFTSQVYINNDVTWIGATKYPTGIDRGYSVAINSVVHETDANDPNDIPFFSSPALGSPGRSGNVNLTVTDDSNLDGKHDVYTINFSVYATGNNHLNYSIDPRLSGNP